jgi:hypothetical protein
MNRNLNGTPTAQSGQTTIVHLNGEMYSQKQIRMLLEGISEAHRDGGRVVVA